MTVRSETISSFWVAVLSLASRLPRLMSTIRLRGSTASAVAGASSLVFRVVELSIASRIPRRVLPEGSGARPRYRKAVHNIGRLGGGVAADKPDTAKKGYQTAREDDHECSNGWINPGVERGGGANSKS